MNHQKNHKSYYLFDGWIDLILRREVLGYARKGFVFLALLGFALSGLLTLSYDMKWLPQEQIPTIFQNYFFSFYIAFSVVLVWEVMSMIYTIPYSLADSVGKQFEIMSLIIIRYLFEHIDKYLKITNFKTDFSEILELFCVTVSALFLYLFIKIFYDIQPHKPITADPTNRRNFIRIKKIFAVILLVTLLSYAAFEMSQSIRGLLSGSFNESRLGHVFFKNMFSIMIFFDILMILLTMWYGARYSVVFRSSALTVSTILLRIAFSEDIFVMIGLTVLSVLFAIGVSWVYMRFDKEPVYKSISHPV